ncbi:MAG: alanine--tRNA ligase [Candidatus Sumerlaeia bacterium]|nr:alanine--tRNA ligase [Candidatus Sumerlaeia bacterium]
MTISNGKELRQAYLEYFRTHPTHPHPIVASAPVVPPDDPTLLFTTAGMVQFKNLYSGLVEPLPYVRSATVQKCLRAGGKGSDLENVGKTLRHHTFFEMLGNFSFGDYFKKEAITFAWTFVTEHMGLDPDRLFPTIFEDDDEAEALWLGETGCRYKPIRLDEKENYWGPAGDTGACGPCSELCYFMGTEEELDEIRQAYKTDQAAAMASLAHRIVEEGDLFLEIWNMVFPQFDQQKDGSRPPLKYRGIDTGAGLERMTVALMKQKTGRPATPYETDLMWPITSAAADAVGVKYVPLADGGDDKIARERLAVNAIADHTRALVFTLTEGITPSNIGRGYVLRRIQRRALRFSSLLGVSNPFMAGLYDAVADTMGDVYPEIKKNPDFIRRAIGREEETFLHTRDRGMKILDELMAQARDRGDNNIAGDEAFRLWDTYGFPLDLTREIATDEGIAVDLGGFNAAMARQKEEARKSWKGAKLDVDFEILDAVYESNGATDFVGYDGVGPVSSVVLAIAENGKLVEELAPGKEAMVVLKSTPFYAESGGQVGDTGVLKVGNSRFEVEDCQKSPQGLYLHKGKLVEGTLKVQDAVEATVDGARRTAIRRNHSSVHLLQAALKEVLGDHVTQAGSWVGPTGSRFDFTHPEGLSVENLRAIEERINALIARETAVETEVMAIDEAKKKGAIAPFGEKYGAVVRVVSMGPESIEFCGGTHVANTGDILQYRIRSESSIASGIRRIEAVAGEGAGEEAREEHYEVLVPLQSRLAVKGREVVERVGALQDRVKELEKEVARLRREMALKDLDSQVDNAREIKGCRVAVVRMDGLGGGELRTVATALRDKLGKLGVAIVLGDTGGKVGLVVASAPDAQGALPAGKIVQKLGPLLGGKGGGKPDMAQGGGTDVAAIDEVMARAGELLTD